MRRCVIEISEKPVDYIVALEKMQQKTDLMKVNACENELIWLLEHNPVYTAGVSAKQEDLLDSSNIPIYKTGRGGKYTYHAPGQRVVYLMLDLISRKQDVRGYVCLLQKIIINTIADFGIKGEMRNGRTGIWVVHNGMDMKIAALGVRVSKGITMHGFAININLDLNGFKGIIPCGISEYGVCSMSQLGVNTTISTVDERLLHHIKNIFSVD